MPLNRPATHAGHFYPASETGIRAWLATLPRKVTNSTATPIGLVVPHAGWIYSGATAWRAISALEGSQIETLVLFGAVHVVDHNVASVYPEGSWSTPLGAVPIDSELANEICRIPGVEADPGVHAREHSIEVEVPLLQLTLGANVRIVPIMIRPGNRCAEIGRRCANASSRLGRKSVYLASTDLTHYGPDFGFEPAGHGEAGLRWAKDVNDRRFISVIDSLSADAAVPEAAVNRNACGSGAVAATIAASIEAGATRYLELEHRTSAEVLPERQPANSVGYEGGIFY